MTAGPIIAGLLIVAMAVILYVGTRYEADPRARDRELRARRAEVDRELGGRR